MEQDEEIDGAIADAAMDEVRRASAQSSSASAEAADREAMAVEPLLIATRSSAADAARLVSAAQTKYATHCAAAARIGAIPVAWGTDAYPPLLGTIADPPPLLWVRGDVQAMHAVCIAIVGSRSASEYGLAVAESLASPLAGTGLVIVSGLARGVDSAAHRGAITSGRTIAVFGSGLDICYPREHTDLAEAIVCNHGCLVSELPIGTPPRPHHFPRRNRIISGLSRAVIVVEASERSGSLQTARFALEQGREVMAVPGSILSDRNRGSHALLKDGACLVEQATDVIEELKLSVTLDTAPTPPSDAPDLVLDSMSNGEVYDFDALIRMTGLSSAALLERLTTHELTGSIARTAGAGFLRVAKAVVR